MMTRAMTCLIAGLLVASAEAQLGRVEDGRANDASLRVGSGGQNDRFSRSTGPYGNQIVEGNVGRGKQFRGFSTISSPTSFGLGTTDFQGVNLGTTALDGFRRDSVSPQAYRRDYQPSRPVPFYSRTNTVISAGGHAVGFQPTGVSRPGRDYIHLPADRFADPSMTDQPYSRQIRLQRYSNLPGLRPSQDASDTPTGYSDPVRRSALFGVPPDPTDEAAERSQIRPGVLESSRSRSLRIRDPRQRPGLIERPHEGVPEDREAPPSSDVLPEGSAMDRLLGKDRHPPDAPARTDARTLTPRREVEDEKPLPFSTQRRVGEPTRRQREMAADRSSVSYRPNEVRPEGDMFRMMRRAASLSTAAQTDKAEAPGPAAAAPGAERGPQADEEQGAPGQDEAQQPPPAREPLAPAVNDEELVLLLQKPIKSFAGSSKSFSDRAFSKAEKELAAGRYYDAVASYDTARAADPANPLIWIGRGHALIGAGDYLAAVQSLEEGLKRFPDLAKFKIDLRAFLGHGDILMIRRADLEERLEKQENYRLRFLLGYLEYYSGLEKFGLPNLIKAAKNAPETSPIASFPAKLQGK